MSVLSALRELKRELGVLGVLSTRVEILMPARDAMLVRRALRPGGIEAPGRSLCQVQGFLLHGDPAIADHTDLKLGEFSDG